MEEAQQAQQKLQAAFQQADGEWKTSMESYIEDSWCIRLVVLICLFFYLEELKQRRFKPLQKNAYLCMAKCCDGTGSQQELQQCFEKCNQPVQQASQFYQAETQRFQQKVQRCASACQDSAQDMMAGYAPDKQDPALVMIYIPSLH